MELQTLDQLVDVKGKVVFVRAGMNVALADDAEVLGNKIVEDSFRIDRVLPTITYLQDKGARVIVSAHIGRDSEENLAPVYHYMQEKLNKFGFGIQTFYELERDGLEEFEKRFTETVAFLKDGEILLLDNLRQSGLEKENSPELAGILAKNIDFYVNEAFPVAHRQHMSVDALPRNLSRDRKYIGLNFENEVSHLTKAQNPEKPALFAISGNKVDTKLPLIADFVERYDYVLVGGVIANTFYKRKGYEVGKSIVDNDITDEEKVMIKTLSEHDSLVLPEYVIAKSEEGERREVLATDVAPDEYIYDISPKSFEQYHFSNVASVLWNGPIGYYEGGFTDGTDNLAKIIAENQNTSIVGGGNTVSAIRSLGYEDSFTFLSTAGGAMLDYLADGDLPAISALLADISDE